MPVSPHHAFAARHIGPDNDELAKILSFVGYSDLAGLMDDALPASIRTPRPLALPPAAAEHEVLAELRTLASRNRPLVQMVGMGYFGTVTPAVIQRNILESPAWYTAYTPYQPEIAQGRLEALMNFQTVVSDLTGLPTANASLLDEATAVAEAMALMRRASDADGSLLVDSDIHPQTLAVLLTRADPLGIDIVVEDLSAGLPDLPMFGVVVQNPGSSGRVRDLAGIADAAHARGALLAVATDLLACTLLRPPGEDGTDVAVGSSQRFGVPPMFGGPHAAFMAVRSGLERQLPGRLVGVSVDADGAPAYRLALQTREQHIRREKASSNICTAQVLLAVVAGMYAVYHGPDGLRSIAEAVHAKAALLAASLRDAGVPVVHGEFFDTVQARIPGRGPAVVTEAAARGINLRLVDDDTVAAACDETTTDTHLAAVLEAVAESRASALNKTPAAPAIPAGLRRSTSFLTHEVFHSYRSETSMLRYLRRLSDRDLALDRTMIPLGSCTMKLNATAEMAAITWPEFAGLHPFAPVEQARGLLDIVEDLERWLAEITGYDAVSLQPNAGSQGELAGLLAVRAYHRAQGHEQRDVCLIPASAHGTNAASAVMAGLRVVVVATDTDGNVALDDLAAKIGEHGRRLAALMVTYPSTHGVFEEEIRAACDLVHAAGGQVYVDGANLNALVGYARPAEFGADVSHLNLHKTFCVPHGGGGPGIGPVAVRAHLAPYLPNHPLVPTAGPATGVGPVAAAPWGSAGILPISWAYVRLMGADGLKHATAVAVASANYVARRLGGHYPVLYRGRGGLVAHECVLDVRPLTKQTGVTVDDIAKRLVDHGFHAPTVSFPVAGTLMIEPTESEDLAELDRFCDAMIAIREEIEQVASGALDRTDNPLRNAPHTASMIAGEWAHPYSRQSAVFPSEHQRRDKDWPPVRRVDGPYGDRNLQCSCPPIESYGPA